VALILYNFFLYIAVMALELEKRTSRMRNFRVVLLGSTGVGKTSLIKQLLYKDFPERHKETLEELHRHVLDMGAMSVEIDILDTSGTHEFPAMRQLAIATGNAFLLVYSVDIRESFANVKFLINEIKENKQGSDYFIIVIANKSDLEDIDKEQKALNESIVCMEWSEKLVVTSAKTGGNIVKVLDYIKEKVKDKIASESKKQPHLRRISMPSIKLTKHRQNALKKNSRTFSAD
jgi:small GTP-binding protein